MQSFKVELGTRPFEVISVNGIPPQRIGVKHPSPTTIPCPRRSEMGYGPVGFRKHVYLVQGSGGFVSPSVCI